MDGNHSKDAFSAYSRLTDQYLHFLRQQSNGEFFYWQGAGIFFLAALVSFILYDTSIIPSALIGILSVGVGCLLIFSRYIRADFKYGTKATICVKQGLHLEKNHDFTPKLFSIFEDNKWIAYRGNVLSRLFPIGLIGLATTGAGILLALKVTVWLAVIVAAFSSSVLCLAARSYVKTARKILLEG